MTTVVGGQGDITDPNAWRDALGNVPPIEFNQVPEDTNYPQNGDGRYWFNVNAFTTDSGSPIEFIGSAPLVSTGSVNLQWSVTNVANDGSTLNLAYLTTQGVWTTQTLTSIGYQLGGVQNGQIIVPMNTLTTEATLEIKVFASGGTALSTASLYQVAVAITRNVNEGLQWDYPEPFNPMSYNAQCMDNAVYTDTLADLRARVISRLGFIDPNTIDTSTTFGQMQTRVQARLGFKSLNAEQTGMTLLALQTYLMQRLGFSNQAANPPPGMANFLTACINEAQQELWRRYAQDVYADAAPTLLVGPTDVLSLDNLAVQLLALAISKAHYGQPDAATIGKQFETYLQELMARQPPNMTLVVNECINSAVQTIWRRYGYDVNGVGGVTVGAPPTYLTLSTSSITVDSQAVELLAVATAKGHFQQKDAEAVGNQAETYITELLKRQPPNLEATVNDFLQSGQRYLYRRYKQLHTTRLFRWKVNPGQRFYSLMDNDEDVLCDFNMDPNKRIEWAGIQDSRNVWYPLVQGIPPQLYTMINKPWRPSRYEIRQAIEVYPAPDQTYWMWFKGHFGLMSFVLDTDSTTLDAELVFLWALANAKAHFGQKDANNIAAQANDYRKELIAGTHQTASYIPGTVAVPPAVRPTLIQYQDNQGG